VCGEGISKLIKGVEFFVTVIVVLECFLQSEREGGEGEENNE